MVIMAKSEKPANIFDPKSAAPKGVTSKAAQAGSPTRAKLPWAQVVSRATPSKPPQRPSAKPSQRPSAKPSHGPPAKPSQHPPAKPSQRPPGRLKPPPLPGAVDAEAIIEVSPEWLEDPAQGRRVSKRPSKPAPQLRFAEAVSVLVGPNGEIEIHTDPGAIPNGYLEALLVATSGGLAERLLKR
jgi:hypothetical protein